MFYKEEKNGTVIYKSTSLDGVRHGFSTRIGGGSVGAAASLNMGYGRGDTAETVNDNRRIFADACGMRGDVVPRVFVTAEQIHSSRIEYVKSASGEDFVCDGFVTDRTGTPIAVKTADCVPILLWDGGGVAAAVHAGWRGTAAGIAAVAVERMCDLGADRRRIRAAIGPSICPGCFVVGEDFAEQFRALASSSPHPGMREGADGIAADFIRRREDGRLHCDLQAINERILRAAGVGEVDRAGICTMERADEFYSHRRDGTARGVMLSAIML